MIPFLAMCVAAILGLAMLWTAIESIRHGHLRERYAVLWVATGAILAAAALAFLLTAHFAPAAFKRMIVHVHAWTGMSSTETILCAISGFMLLLLFQISIALSTALNNQARLARRIALLKAELEETRRRDAGK